MASDEFVVLRVLRLKGRADAAGLSAASGLDAATAAATAASLIASGHVREVRENWMLLPDGRSRLEDLLAQEREDVDQDALKGVYEDFGAVNADFKQLASDWQLRGGSELNDHSDAAYDQSVLDRLPSIHARVTPVLERALELAPRLAPYADRLQHAFDRVSAGDHGWLLKPLIDSYHTVWFELHEELIGLSGLSREAEAASGRAE